MKREDNIKQLSEETFDICIIGGGASGAGAALDAALRGYKVALIEKEDFGSETSSKSTKMVHGGVRYLEQAFKKFDFAQLRQVRHGLEERHNVLKNAPHLAKPLALVTPVSSWLEGLYYRVGLAMYDRFAQNDFLPKSRWLTKKEVLEKMPTLNASALHSGVVYYDGQLDDARYCLALVQSADENRASVANYLTFNGFDKDSTGKLISARLTDNLSNRNLAVSARIFLNCTGAHADEIRLKANPTLFKRLRPSKGVHITLPAKVMATDWAMLIPKTPDGRVVFAIPFEGELIIGTTDTEVNNISLEPTLEASEADFLLSTISPYLTKPPLATEIQAGFAGLRPLLAADRSRKTKSLTRDHEVEHDRSSNLVSLLGGKWTTYRLMAKDAIDEIDKILGYDRMCMTTNYTLAGGEDYSDNLWLEIMDSAKLDEDIARHFAKKYGSRAKIIEAMILADKNLAKRIIPDLPYVHAEVIYSARVEMAQKPRDFLARRIRLEIADWKAAINAVPTVATLMARELGWDSHRTRKMTEEYQTQLKDFVSRAGIKKT